MPAYQVALCEDEPMDRDQLAGLCREIFSSWNIEAQLTAFPSADTLRAALETGQAVFDLYLLDIQMAGTSGLEMARWLYDRGIRDRVVFITGNPEYALAGYDAHPLHYRLKPVDRERLEAALHLALEKRRPQTILLRWGGKTAALPLGEIRWVESRDHGVVVCLGEEERAFPLSFRDAERLLPGASFRRCHKSYLVNMDWVDHLTRGGVILRDKRQLPVSRTYYAGFQSALVQYLNQRRR